MRLKSILESLIFASDRPITIKQLQELTGAKNEELKEILSDLELEFKESGIQLIAVGGGHQFRTNPENANWVKKLLAGRPARLTRPMLETLAIVAYRQPVTRPEIEDIRGVDSGSTLRVLLERSLLRIVGRKEEAGRPILYGTSKFFLEFFNLQGLKDLPPLSDFTELTEEHEQQVEMEHGVLPTELRLVHSDSDNIPENVDMNKDTVQPELEAESQFEVGNAIRAEQNVQPAPLPNPYEEEEEDVALDSLKSAMERISKVLDRKENEPFQNKPKPNTPIEPKTGDNIDNIDSTMQTDSGTDDNMRQVDSSPVDTRGT
ncbi:MAG: SMC-Scp complex subunit ScpB [Pseudomonadota bacterium]